MLADIASFTALGSELVCIKQIRLIVCGFALFLIAAPLHGRGYKYHRRVPVGLDFVRGRGQDCGSILIDLESGDFFEGLEVKNTQAGLQFRKGQQSVEYFPREVIVIVRVSTSQCVGPPDPHDFHPDFTFDQNFISSLQFQAFWQRGFESRRADLGLFSSGEGRRDSFERNFSVNWRVYVLKIRCPNVPLTDSLTVVILSSDGKRVGRFALKLGTVER